LASAILLLFSFTENRTHGDLADCYDDNDDEDEWTIAQKFEKHLWISCKPRVDC